MRGPSEEKWQQISNTNTNQNRHHYNSTQYQSQVPQQQTTQSTANFNGNNSRSHRSNGVRQQQNGNADIHNNSYQNVQQSPTNDASNPFAEYAWMADAEEFDKQVMEQMEQEEYLEACFQELWQEEENDGEWYTPPQGDAVRNQSSNVESLNRMTLDETQVPTILNPNAAEFIPRRAIVHQ